MQTITTEEQRFKALDQQSDKNAYEREMETYVEFWTFKDHGAPVQRADEVAARASGDDVVLVVLGGKVVDAYMAGEPTMKLPHIEGRDFMDLCGNG